LATYSGSNGERELDVSHQATWSIDDATVGSLGDNGLVTANNKQNSELVLTANFAALTDTANFKVNDVTLESIRIAPEDVKFDEVLPVDLSVNYLVYGQYSDGIERPINASEVTWSASVNGLVTINNDGNVLGLAAGELAIQAQYVTDQTHNATDDLRVSDLDLWNVYLSPNPYTTAAGTSVQYQLLGSFSDRKIYPIPLADVAQWGSSMPEVASVLVAEGKAQTELEGSTVISAWYNGYVANADLHVTPSCIPGTFGRAAILVDTTIKPYLRVDFTADLVAGSSMTIDWGDGNTQVWTGGGAPHTYTNDYQGEVVFTWDACNPVQIENLYLRYGWTGDINQLNQLPIVGGSFTLNNDIYFDGDVSTLRVPVTGAYFTHTRDTTGALDNISLTATSIKAQGYEDINASAVGDSVELIRTYNNVSLVGTAAELPQNGALKTLYTTPISSTQENQNFSYDVADLPRTLIREIYLSQGAVGTGLIEDLPPMFGSEPNTSLNGRVYFKLNSAPSGEIVGNWNNFDWSNWTQHTERFSLDGAIIPTGDIEQFMTAGPALENLYIHGNAGGQYADIYGNADNLAISNKLGMQIFHILTRGALQATGANGPKATKEFYIYSTHPGSSYHSLTTQLPVPTVDLTLIAGSVQLNGSAADIMANPSRQFFLAVTDAGGNLTGSFNEQGKDVINAWRVYGAGNKATIDLVKIGFNATSIHFYGDKDGLNGGIASMSGIANWSRVSDIIVEMIEQSAMDNLLNTIKLSPINSGVVRFNQPTAPANATLINDVKVKGWRVFHNATEL
uniref:hypothetical protein n=1 Tax=Shewanella marina TaxID=487319 RepID=UPI00055E96B1